jgi:hypothetical protein
MDQRTWFVLHSTKVKWFTFEKKMHEEIFVPIAAKVLPVYDKLLKSSASDFLLPSGLFLVGICAKIYF